MSFRVELTAGAFADLDRLSASLGARSAEMADRFTASFYESLSRLESRPFSCGLAYENRYFSEEVRHLLFRIGRGRRYRALFIIRGDMVTVLCVRAPGERPARPEDIET
jgi:hypothetical protein